MKQVLKQVFDNLFHPLPGIKRTNYVLFFIFNNIGGISILAGGRNENYASLHRFANWLTT